MKRLGRWCRETFRYGFLIVFFPRSITLEFLERPDTELRRWLRLLPCFLSTILLFLVQLISEKQTAKASFGEPIDELCSIILAALLSTVGSYYATALMFWIPHRIWGGDWRKVKTVASLYLYATGIGLVFVAVVGLSITLAVYVGTGDGMATNIVAGVLFAFWWVTVALATTNIHTMESAVIGASPSALFWFTNGGFAAAYFVLVVVMASIRGPVL